MNARIGCVILAAGGSRRLGGSENKLLLPYAGKPLLQRAIDAASASAALFCTLVVGAKAEEVLRAIDARRCTVIQNRQWRQGMASSIRAGLAGHLEDAACMFMLADQPFVTWQDLDRLIDCFADQRTAMVALRSGGIWGTPMLFPRSDFDALLRLHGDTGAKRYAQRNESRLRFVDAQHEDAFADVDTMEDYQRLTAP